MGDIGGKKDCDKDLNACRTNVQELNDKLETYMKAIRPFGSSSGLIKTSQELQNGFHNVLQAFKANNAEILAEFFSETGSIDLTLNSGNPSAEATTQRLPLMLAGHMRSLSGLLSDFLKGLSEIPEFSDKPLADVLGEFQAWLNCRAERIISHEGGGYCGENCPGEITSLAPEHVDCGKYCVEGEIRNGLI
ncbi:hypothetical protein FRC00_002820 [Tulasnella sp. 408]|nr:hypothetical protein FRC00_002820 [Tulasnella sp. 408]